MSRAKAKRERAKRADCILTPDARAALDRLMARYGHRSKAAAIRMAILMVDRQTSAPSSSTAR